MTRQAISHPLTTRQGDFETLAAIVRHSTDRTSLSDELHFAASDAFDREHLDHGRANVLRGLTLPKDSTVVELGSATGALTRYLGEQVAAVHPVERDPGLVTIANHRTADLPNVAPSVSSLHELTCTSACDIVVVSGECALAPEHAALEHIRRILRPGGALCVVVANRRENGGYDWENALRQAGFQLATTLTCLPDATVTNLVYDAGAGTGDSPPLGDRAGRAERSDAPPGCLLLAATPPADGGPTVELWPPRRLATAFKTDRAAAWCVRGHADGDESPTSVRYRPMMPDQSQPGHISVQTFEEKVTSCSTVADTILRRPWQARSLLTAWHEQLQTLEPQLGPLLWNVVPTNIRMGEPGTDEAPCPLSLEWSVSGCTAEIVLRRGVLLIADHLSRQGWAGAAADSTVGDLAAWLAVLLGLPPDSPEAAVEWESWFETALRCGGSSTPGFDHEHSKRRTAWLNRLTEPIWFGSPHVDACFEDGSGADESAAAIMRNVSREIADGDTMFRGSRRHYFHASQDALKACLDGMQAGRRRPPQRILDFGCGHGRVLRTLRAAFPGATLFGADVDADGVEYCRNVFGAVGITTSTTLRELEPLIDMDLVWAGSVLTHLDADDWQVLLGYVVRALAPGGVAVLTTHGRTVARRIARQGKQYGLAADAAASVLSDYRRFGFGYENYPGQAGYGISLSTIGWVTNLVSRFPGARVAGYTEAGWDSHQDILVLVKDIDTIAIARRSGTSSEAGV